MFGFLLVVMKHPYSSAIGMLCIQCDFSFATRVSPSSNAWRALIKIFDTRGEDHTVILLTKVLAPQGDNYSVDAYLQRVLHYYQNINEDEHILHEKLLVDALYKLNNKLFEARAKII
jgi:hypothetical protein